MSENEACGSGAENQRFLPDYEDVNQFMQQTLKSVLQATKTSNEMPAAGDDWDYYSSFPAFQDVMNLEGKRILHVVQSILKHQNVRVNMGNVGGAADIEDKLDMLMDANDQILERVGTWLDEAAGIKKNDSSLVVATATPKTQTSASWNKKSPGAMSAATPSFRLLSARNIQHPQLKFHEKIDNSLRPFTPIIKDKPHAIKPLDESLRLLEGTTPDEAEKSDFQHPHPYRYEIEELQYCQDQLTCSVAQDPASLADTPCTFVHTVEHVQDMLQHLKQQTVIAVDLEHHSYRTFQGITCLMQISSRSHDYLIDTLQLRSDLQCLNDVFADPSIVKVLHGADMDIEWLQRDLGVYIVNMFDTGQAARVMGFSRFSLAYLLQQYCGVAADKQYQLADWRIRPLPAELQKYAREDTHYLLYIYDKMKTELIDRGNNSNNLLLSVLHRSSQVCLKVYKKPVCPAEGYMELYRKNKKVFNSQQLLALKELFTWRDETARMEDESYGYVLPNHMLLQICDILPRERQGVLACCNPIPPLVRQYLNEIHIIIQKARDAPLYKVETVREHKPSQSQHPKYDVDSLLHCPHDMSHQDLTMDTDTQSCLLDISLTTRKSELCSTVIVVKHRPLLTAFETSNDSRPVKTAVKKSVEEIKASFVSPYLHYMPDSNAVSSVMIPGKLDQPIRDQVRWRLLPCSVKRKKGDTMDSPAPTEPPSKRSHTDLQSDMTVKKHIRFTDNDEAMDEDDKKAIPQDIEIPLRFQMPSKKKTKKNKNKDIDLIESVQEHIANIRKLQEANDFALGQNPGDEQPQITHVPQQKHKPKAKDKKESKDKKEIKPKVSEKPVECDYDTSVESKAVKGPSVNETEVRIEIEDTDSDEVKVVNDEFTPFDYKEGAKQLMKGAGPRGNQRDYYTPGGAGGRGKSKNMRNRTHMNKGQKSFTWKK